MYQCSINTRHDNTFSNYSTQHVMYEISVILLTSCKPEVLTSASVTTKTISQLFFYIYPGLKFSEFSLNQRSVVSRSYLKHFYQERFSTPAQFFHTWMLYEPLNISLAVFQGLKCSRVSVQLCFLFTPGEAVQGKQTSKNGKIVSQNAVPSKGKVVEN